MTIKDCGEKSFEGLVYQLNENREELHCRKEMEEFVKYQVDHDIEIAFHVLKALYDYPAEWYIYDFSEGINEPVIAVACKKTLEVFIEEK